MDRQQFQSWLDRYVEAWKSYDPQQIGALFSADAEYRYHPQDEPERGRDEIVAAWLHQPDEPGAYDAHYEPVAIDGDSYVAMGWSRYYDAPGGKMRDEYCNIYVCRFNAASECTSFTEYWIQNREMRERAVDAIVEKRMTEAASGSARS
jgi:hypothetical protein